jgi:hypothetical protein
MKKLKRLTSAPARLSVAMPLIFGLATIAAAPTVEAAATDQVDVVNSIVDVDEDGVLGEVADDTVLNVLLNCNDATSIQANILSGAVDVTGGGAINGSDDAFNCDLNDLNAGVTTTNEVTFLNGCTDVNEDGVCNNSDDATDVKLIILP